MQCQTVREQEDRSWERLSVREKNWQQSRPEVDPEGGSLTAFLEVLQQLEDQGSADTCQPTGAPLDNLEGRETFYLHSVLCLVSLASDLLGLTPF